MSDVSSRMSRLSVHDRKNATQEGFSSDDSEMGNPQDLLIFEYFEQDPPYSREPLADKASTKPNYCVIFFRLI